MTTNFREFHALGFEDLGIALPFLANLEEDREDALFDQGADLTALTIRRSRGRYAAAMAVLVERSHDRDPEAILLDREAREDAYDDEDGDDLPYDAYERTTRYTDSGTPVIVRKRIAEAPAKAPVFAKNARGLYDVSSLGLECAGCHKPVTRLPFIPRTPKPVTCGKCHAKQRREGARKHHPVKTVEVKREARPARPARRQPSRPRRPAPAHPYCTQSGTHGNSRRWHGGVPGAFGKNAR